MAEMHAVNQRLKWPLIIAVGLIVIRIVLEQLGAPEVVNNIFGVAWLYFLVPIYFAIQIRQHAEAGPVKSLLIHVSLFAVYTRLMVMVTYMLAYVFKWSAPRFHLQQGGVVGEGVTPLQGLLLIPLRNLVIWVVSATIIGMIIGGITLALKKSPAAESAA
ncbi:MAG: hypothetical protein D6814_09975 [Calditrichaeota bacterium]|nr:MAG: hypothetical protein D6814_09975 [Calditrichota bacterium]